MEKSSEICLNSDKLKKISIPSTGFVENHVIYSIEVSLHDYSWTVNRRYREFWELHEKLTEQFPILEKTTFPPKKLFGNFDPTHVEKRRKCLEDYLQSIIAHLGKIPRPLQIFLEFHVYDVLAVTQTLAEELYTIGDTLLAREEPFVFTPLQLYCISRRLKLPLPTCGGEGYHYDVGNLYDIVYCLQNLEIMEDDKHNLNNFSDEEISFDLSLFKNLKTLQISKCNIESLRGTFHLQEKLEKLSVHNSLHLLKEILIDQNVWTHGDDVLKQECFSVSTWKHLTVIDLSHNDIPHMDESVTLLHEVVRMDLSYNKIKEITHLQGLPKLAELNLSFNEIDNLNAVNTKLGNITSLRLAGNRLTNVGDLPKMFSLVNLDLSENSIGDISDVMSLARLPCLENLILLANPVRHTSMYRLQLLAAFDDQLSRICLDQVVPTEKEIRTVIQMLAEEDEYEFVKIDDPTNISGHRKAPRRKVKTKPPIVLEKETKTEGPSLAVQKTTDTDEGKEFRDKVDKIRKLGGDDWLTLLNEMQSEHKHPGKTNSTSLPGNAASACVKNGATTLPSSAKDVNGQQSKSSTALQFGFSPELEDLVKVTIEKDKDVTTGTFFVRIEGDVGDEERMVVVDLKKEILMAIALDTVETYAKHKLADISSVDILESSGCWYVDLLHAEHKELRRHADLHVDSGTSASKANYRHVAKYRMRSMKDATELFVLLYKFIWDSLSERPSERSNSDPSQTPQRTVSNDVTSLYSNPIGLPPDLLSKFLSCKFGWPIESELTESARHATETVRECVHVILWLSCLPYALPEHEFPVCLILTNMNIHLFHLLNFVTPPKKVEKMDEILSFMCCLPLTEMVSVKRGVFNLTFRLEFAKRATLGTFTFLTRDSEMTEAFINVLKELTSGTTPVIFNDDFVKEEELRLEKLKREIALSCGKTFKDDECVLIYSVVRELTEETSSNDNHALNTIEMTTSSTESHISRTRSLILTNRNLFLCEEDHLHWPLPSYVRFAPSTPQWVVTKHDDIKHLIGIEVYDVMGGCTFVGSSGMSLLLENNARTCEDLSGMTGHESHKIECESRKTKTWNVIFKLKEEREQFQRSLSKIWSYYFHGDLKTTESKPILATNIRHVPRIDFAAEFFQERLPPSGLDCPENRTKKSHRRNASGQFSPTKHSMRNSMQVLHSANAEILETFFIEILRQKSGNDTLETLVSYTWTGCVAYSNPSREIHVWLVLSSTKVYIVADVEDRKIIGASQDVVFGTGNKFCFHWLALTWLRQVCVGFFDQTFRLETDDPEGTFIFITRDYQVTGCFLENLTKIFKEIGDEGPPPVASSDSSPSIYDAYPSNSNADIDHSSVKKFHHSKGVVQFVYTNDDTVEILKHTILGYAKESEYCASLNDIDIYGSILVYLLMFQVVDGKKLARTFIVFDRALCTCVENHVNFPLPLFVKGLPMGSRYEVQCLRLITDIKRIEFSGSNTQDFTIVFKKQRIESETKIMTVDEGDVKNSACRVGEECWTMVAQTYEEKEKALGIILRFWKEHVGEDLPVLNIS
ncbi:nischarin-like [Dendronephthya gigantea]|uniref:nischarin-like n=1 Tax=Dendronephthya gigantea TaxID=151771 RepID=UPI00106D8CD7|nr:nischarin-like [Dendronephthya gigantea]